MAEFTYDIRDLKFIFYTQTEIIKTADTSALECPEEAFLT